MYSRKIRKSRVALPRSPSRRFRKLLYQEDREAAVPFASQWRRKGLPPRAKVSERERARKERRRRRGVEDETPLYDEQNPEQVPWPLPPGGTEIRFAKR